MTQFSEAAWQRTARLRAAIDALPFNTELASGTLSRERFLSYARQTESFYLPEFDVVSVDSRAREWMTAFRHSMRVLFGVYPRVDSGVQPAADVQDRPGDVPGLLRAEIDDE